ncbi:4'-phosphopantetheinyl transferase superfamily protein [Persicimonas caeni]|uniref:4'-phosphopantetheinyl transferase superfamily protein n=1 Tax=Persicimonas caeni TaxID=2292766 RepID=A0A4Y6PW84_PERCE|nr:4'-phosphopantetheinyl transferase superfamily protein [Persicimonas caeni]QDG52578.1 4'-phosphopantetheinyl transferase superfamily protein [Persicimonas caeni]QED33800.1 4'-phosphopantetheinyl transferase superfamily protein [Persicimonas caeni]
MWQAPPDALELQPNTVDVWRLSLEQPAPLVARAAELLTDDEAARAARFRFERDRISYTLTRSQLRRLLGAYLDKTPCEIDFVNGNHGKPAVADTSVEFNVSHSGTYSLLAFCQDRPVGVDLEQIRPRKSLALVAEHHFAPGECETVMAPDTDRERLVRFYRCWTRKEAFMKATGQGLALGLKTFEVSVDDDPRLLWVEDGEPEAWQLSDLQIAAGYAGALCVDGVHEIEVRPFDS